ncbi:MAG: alpha/beta hydrolase [Candidatus Binataceae bacterium]
MAASGNYEIDVEEVEYLRHGDQPLVARIFKPRGAGPFPAMVGVHGGAWNLMDRTADDAVNRPLAESGVVVAAIDFRMPPQASYPASLADINYAIRWFKTRATEFGGDPERVGLIGSSSGGHQVMLTGMRPRDPRYCAIALPAGASSVDAGVRCVVMLWPVIDPLARYHFAKQLKESGKPYPELVDTLVRLHDKYWITEEAMAEGNPALALQRGERVALPPTLYIQGADDFVHPRVDLDLFVANYRKAGGHLELELYDGMAEGFIIRKRSSDAAANANRRIAEFVHQYVH